MSNLLDRDQIIDLLENVLGTFVTEASKSKSDIQYNCQIHGESTPSAGVSVEKNLFNCFSCHARGNLSWLVYKSLPDEFRSLTQVNHYLKERYGVDLETETTKIDIKDGIKRYDDFLNNEKEEKTRFTMSRYKIAPFKSGKETYRYFYDRGFSEETLVSFNIGRDTRSKTVTIPVFWEDKELAGIIGRYIDPNRPKNQRYKLYEFPKGSTMFPLDKLEVGEDKTIILVEGILDALWLHQLGFKNTLSILGNGMSKEQAKIVKSKARSVIDMFDRDTGGETARKIARNMLGSDMIYYTTEYPEGRYDPQDCNLGEIQTMIDNKVNVRARKITRL